LSLSEARGDPRFMTSLDSRHYPKSMLIPADQDMLWRVERGIVRTSTLNEQGKITALGYWRTGDVVGQPLNALEILQIECITTVEATPLQRDAWSFHLPAILRHSQMKAQLISHVMNESVPQRLVHVLRWLGRRFGVPLPDGVLIDLPLSHTAMGELIGSTRVTMTRTLGNLSKQNILAQAKRSRIILLPPLPSNGWGRNQSNRS
jgi:CRP-like cAMP-binding protein